jgi:hypothetical protein
MTDLYRHFDKDGNLLYFGISLSAYERMRQYKRIAMWAGGQSVRLEVEHFPSCELARKAEAEAEANTDERPLFNIAGSFPEQGGNAVTGGVLS